MSRLYEAFIVALGAIALIAALLNFRAIRTERELALPLVGLAIALFSLFATCIGITSSVTSGAWR